jgi:hypothetical protein
MKNVVHVVFVLPLKFGDHRRWSGSERVGLMRRRLGWRVAVRPASPGGRAWPNNFHFRLRTCWCMLYTILVKFRNLYNCLSVRNRTGNIIEYWVTVGWLPNLNGMLK